MRKALTEKQQQKERQMEREIPQHWDLSNDTIGKVRWEKINLLSI